MIDLEPLVKMGLPWGPPFVREPGPTSLHGAREAVRLLAEAPELPPNELREPLLAWLSAFRHHWPDTWKRELGAPGVDLLERLSAAPYDANRYIKLRRIAIESLARII